MHPLCPTYDCVNRACRDTQRAPNTPALVYYRDGQRSLESVHRIRRQRREIQQLCERFDASCAARRALIDLGFAGRNRFRVGPATLVATLSALRLREQGVDTIGYGHLLSLGVGPNEFCNLRRDIRAPAASAEDSVMAGALCRHVSLLGFRNVLA